MQALCRHTLCHCLQASGEVRDWEIEPRANTSQLDLQVHVDVSLSKHFGVPPALPHITGQQNTRLYKVFIYTQGQQGQSVCPTCYPIHVFYSTELTHLGLHADRQKRS